MPDPTYYLRSEVKGAAPTNESFPQFSAGYIEHAAILALFNGEGSNAVLRLSYLDIDELVGRSTTIPVKWSMQRVSALGAGEALPAMKLDSADADLPSQVSVVELPGSFTVSGNELRTVWATPLLTSAGTIFARTPGAGRHESLNRACVYSAHDANPRRQVLREGQGLILWPSQNAATVPYKIQVLLQLMRQSSGACYAYSTVLVADQFRPLVGVFNGSGSGVVLEVSRLEVQETFDFLGGTGPPLFTIETISGIHGGVDVPVYKADSADADLPAEVLVRHNAAVTQANVDAHRFRRPRGGGDLPLRKASRAISGVGVEMGTILRQYVKGRTLQYDDPALAYLTLREGDGVAVLQRLPPHLYSNCEITAAFSAVVTPPSGGGVGPSIRISGPRPPRRR